MGIKHVDSYSGCGGQHLVFPLVLPTSILTKQVMRNKAKVHLIMFGVIYTYLDFHQCKIIIKNIVRKDILCHTLQLMSPIMLDTVHSLYDILSNNSKLYVSQWLEVSRVKWLNRFMK